MELKDLTPEQLKKERPDLVQVILVESASSEEEKKKQERMTLLESQLDEAKLKLALHDRAQLVQTKLLEAKLPEMAVTDAFKKQLMSATDDKAMDEIIADRIKLLEGSAGTKSSRKGSTGSSESGNGNKTLAVDDLLACLG